MVSSVFFPIRNERKHIAFQTVGYNSYIFVCFLVIYTIQSIKTEYIYGKYKNTETNKEMKTSTLLQNLNRRVFFKKLLTEEHDKHQHQMIGAYYCLNLTCKRAEVSQFQKFTLKLFKKLF